MKIDKVQFDLTVRPLYFHSKYTMLSSDDNINWQYLLVFKGKLSKNSWVQCTEFMNKFIKPVHPIPI